MTEQKRSNTSGGKGKQRGNRPRSAANGGSRNKNASGATNDARTNNKNQAGNKGRSAEAKTRPRPSDRFLFHLTRRVFFVGFMGAGKTSVARRVARDCALSAVDMDTYLERSRDCKVKTLFDRVGEEGFRDIEHEVLLEMTELDPLLISCGGGVIKRAENRQLLRDCGFVIYLNVSADEASGRIRNIATRPLFKDIDNARKTNAEREPLYEEVADATINTAGKSVARIAHEARRILLRKGVLCQQPK
ncbi:MAG: shikimate kinase [Raoultibacter sp.]